MLVGFRECFSTFLSTHRHDCLRSTTIGNPEITLGLSENRFPDGRPFAPIFIALFALPFLESGYSMAVKCEREARRPIWSAGQNPAAARKIMRMLTACIFSFFVLSTYLLM